MEQIITIRTSTREVVNSWSEQHTYYSMEVLDKEGNVIVWVDINKEAYNKIQDVAKRNND